jgi:hypothetical protein
MVDVTCTVPLDVQFGIVLGVLHASAGLYTMLGALLDIKFCGGVCIEVVEG